jgi:uncharacterized membrane protein
VARASQSITIRAPRDVVFGAVTDPRRTMEWNTNIVEMSNLSEHPARLGTTWSQTAMLAGIATQLRCRIVHWDPPTAGVLDISGGQSARVTTECRDVDGATRVVQTVDFTPPGGVLGAIAAGLIAKQISGELAKALKRQQATLEQEFGASSGSATR